MPKATVDLHGDAIVRNDQIRAAREVIGVQLGSEAELSHYSRYGFFRRRALRANPRHQA